MSLADRLTAAMEGRTGTPELFPDRLAAACVAVLPVDGAGVTTTSTPGRRLPVGSSDPTSQAAERLQFTLGEGPCLQAQHAQSPVRATAGDLAQRWPAYWVGLSTGTPFRSVLALPLPGQLAAVDLFFHAEQPAAALADAVLVELTTTLSALVVAELASTTEEHLGVPSWRWGPAPTARMAVWQAVGSLAAEWDVGTGEALSLLRAHAFGAGQDLETAAEDVLAGRAPERPAAVGRVDGTAGSGQRSASVRHPLLVLPAHHLPPDVWQVDGRPVHTALPRGRHRDHELVCGTCGTTLAWGHRPAPLAHPAPLLRCPRCRSLNDPTVESSGVS